MPFSSSSTHCINFDALTEEQTAVIHALYVLFSHIPFPVSIPELLSFCGLSVLHHDISIEDFHALIMGMFQCRGHLVPSFVVSEMRGSATESDLFGDFETRELATRFDGQNFVPDTRDPQCLWLMPPLGYEEVKRIILYYLCGRDAYIPHRLSFPDLREAHIELLMQCIGVSGTIHEDSREISRCTFNFQSNVGIQWFSTEHILKAILTGNHSFLECSALADLLESGFVSLNVFMGVRILPTAEGCDAFAKWAKMDPWIQMSHTTKMLLYEIRDSDAEHPIAFSTLFPLNIFTGASIGFIALMGFGLIWLDDRNMTVYITPSGKKLLDTHSLFFLSPPVSVEDSLWNTLSPHQKMILGSIEDSVLKYSNLDRICEIYVKKTKISNFKRRFDYKRLCYLKLLAFVNGEYRLTRKGRATLMRGSPPDTLGWFYEVVADLINQGHTLSDIPKESEMGRNLL